MPPPPGPDPSAAGYGEPSATEADPGGNTSHLNALAEVTIMPPPIGDDPWTPSAEPSDPGDGVA
jgi:hypothetical protein